LEQDPSLIVTPEATAVIAARRRRERLMVMVVAERLQISFEEGL